MNNSRQSKLICVYGLGQSGIATARYLQRTQQDFFVVDSRADPVGLELLNELSHCHAIHLQTCAQELLNNSAFIILTPGVSPKIAPIVNAKKAGVKVVGDIEIFVSNTTKKIVAITGSNGKSTVTDLTHQLLCAAGYNAKIGGNFGVPVLDFLPSDDADIYVLELSSFQLDTTESLRADVAVVLNICEDHMDRYDSLESYRQSKLTIYNNSRYGLINADDPQAFSSAQAANDAFSLHDVNCKYHLAQVDNDYWLVCNGIRIIKTHELEFSGQHNWSNALAALGILDGLGIDISDAVIKQLRTYRGLAHRFSLVKTDAKVDWINDSKATNVGATIAALQSVDCNYYTEVILIAGGLAKDADLEPLRAVFANKISHLILMGTDAKLLAVLFDDKLTYFVQSMSEAVSLARTIIDRSATHQTKKLVLLSPACASLDMFKNYEARGNAFVEAVEACA